MSKNLLYQPDLTYEKNYYTEGDLYNSTNEELNEESSSSNNLIDKIDNLGQLKDDLLSKLPLLPESIQNVIKPSIDIIGDVVDDLVDKKDDIEDDEDKPGIDIIPVYPSDDSPSDKDTDKAPDNPFNSESSNTISIPDEKVDIGKEVEKQYIEDLSDVLEDYLKKQNGAIRDYINSIITYASYSNHNTVKTYTSATVSNKNLTHVTDYITKSKIGVKQQIRLYKKLFTMDETIYHLKAIKIAKEQLKRYKSNERLQDTNLLTKSANDLLIESRLVAEKKYEENFYGLYKYLNSSVIIFNECMNTFVKQKRSLILLNNEERE